MSLIENVPDEVMAIIFSFVFDNNNKCPYTDNNIKTCFKVSYEWKRIISEFLTKNCVYNNYFQICRYHDNNRINYMKTYFIKFKTLQEDRIAYFHILNNNDIENVINLLKEIYIIPSRNNIIIENEKPCCNNGMELSLKWKYKRKLKKLLEHIYILD
jgi:hypothetical protein